MKTLCCLLLSGCLAVARAGELSVRTLEAAADYAMHGGSAFLVEQRGRIVVERYANDSGPGEAHRVFSLSKNLWALAAAAAERDGLLEWDEPASKTLAEWQDDARRSITIRDLLNMTAGLKTGGQEIYFGGDRDFSRAALGLPLLFRPGSVFDYGPAGIENFGELLERKMRARHSSAVGFLRTKVLQPGGISVASFKADAAGGLMFSSGTRMTAPNVLRLGKTVMRLAKTGKSPELFRGSRANPGYGLTFWLNRGSREIPVEEALEKWKPGDRRWRSATLARAAPSDTIAMVGSRNQRVYVVPSMDLIIVRLGDSKSFSDARFWEILLNPKLEDGFLRGRSTRRPWRGSAWPGRRAIPGDSISGRSRA